MPAQASPGQATALYHNIEASVWCSEGLPHIIHWRMLRDGGFLFSPSQVVTEEQYSALAQYQEYQDYQYHDEDQADSAQLPLTEDRSYDPYDELFTVTGYDLPAFGNEVYDSENSSYNIVRF